MSDKVICEVAKKIAYTPARLDNEDKHALLKFIFDEAAGYKYKPETIELLEDLAWKARWQVQIDKKLDNKYRPLFRKVFGGLR